MVVIGKDEGTFQGSRPLYKTLRARRGRGNPRRVALHLFAPVFNRQASTHFRHANGQRVHILCQCGRWSTGPLTTKCRRQIRVNNLWSQFCLYWCSLASYWGPTTGSLSRSEGRCDAVLPCSIEHRKTLVSTQYNMAVLMFSKRAWPCKVSGLTFDHFSITMWSRTTQCTLRPPLWKHQLHQSPLAVPTT